MIFIENDDEYQAALKELGEFLDMQTGASEIPRFHQLLDAVEDYEEKFWPVVDLQVDVDER